MTLPLFNVEVLDVIHATDPEESIACLRLYMAYREIWISERRTATLAQVEAVLAQWQEVRRLLLSRPELFALFPEKTAGGKGLERIPNVEAPL